jgi:hypothetical protein
VGPTSPKYVPIRGGYCGISTHALEVKEFCEWCPKNAVAERLQFEAEIDVIPVRRQCLGETASGDEDFLTNSETRAGHADALAVECK